MMSSADTTGGDDACAKWDSNQAHFKNAPPTKGKVCIEHVASLLNLFEPFSAINPVAQGVVDVLKVIVSYELERRENDTRMGMVLLAKGDLVRVLLNVYKVTQRHSDTQTDTLSSVATDIMTQFKQCHNCMDAYFKQNKISKFFQAMQWKAKFTGFVSKFDALRQRLMTILGIQTAFNVSQMAVDMNILTRLFGPQNPKEKEFMKEIDAVRSDVLKGDIPALQKLVASIEGSSMAKNTPDTSHDVKDGEKKGSSKPDPKKVASVNTNIYMDELREEIQSSVDTLCQKNLKHFEMSLALHMDQLKKSIHASADRVINSLSGPYDRLWHNDLRELWKEMKWIFCVETRIFALALCEYYRDLYVHPHTIASDILEEKNDSDTPEPSSRRTAHPDAWTLPYLVIFTKATETIDDDNSGYIRISEANEFTSRIPEGWTLPRYCAYLIEGRHHEIAIYRQRIIHLRNRAHEMHAQLLPGNRYAATYVVDAVCDSIIDKLALNPRPEYDTPSIAPELHKLVKNKILDQDSKIREVLEKFKYSLDKSTTGMLFLDQNLEEYIFPLAYAFMEMLLDFHHFCCSSTADIRQWSASIAKPFNVLRSMIDDRIKELNGNERTSGLSDHHRGIWLWFGLPDFGDLNDKQQREFVKYMFQNIDHHLDDTSFIEDFPLPAFRGDLVTRTHPTWEEFSESNDISAVPEDCFAYEWNSGVDGCLFEFIPKEEGFFDLPTLRYCNKCRSEPLVAMYNCLECDDFDLCHDCYDKHPPEHKVDDHEFGHAVALVATYLQRGRRTWIRCQAARETDQCRDEILGVQARKRFLEPENTDSQFGGTLGYDEDLKDAIEDEANETGTDEESADIMIAYPPKQPLYECFVCQAWVTLETRFFICGEYSCREGRRICQECALQQHDNVDTHFWWHSLLPIDERVLGHSLDTSSTGESSTAPPEQTTLANDSEQNAPPESVMASTYDSQAYQFLENLTGGQAAVEQRIKALESKMDERFAVIETMLKKLLGLDVGAALLVETSTAPPMQPIRQGPGRNHDRQQDHDNWARDDDDDDDDDDEEEEVGIQENYGYVEERSTSPDE